MILEYADDGDLLGCMVDLNVYAASNLRIDDAFELLVDAVRHCQ
jgi:hypothetical protein